MDFPASNECISENSTENDEETRTKRNAVDAPLKSQTLPDGSKTEEFSSSSEEEINWRLVINKLSRLLNTVFLVILGSKIQVN